MKNKPYSVTGDKDNGFRIAVPTEIGVKKGDRYDCTFVPTRMSGMIIPAGSLVYVPHVDDNAGTGGSGKIVGPEAIKAEERERILDLVDDAISDKSWEIDTHSDDGFQRIVYCSEVDKIIGSFRTPDLTEENKPGCFGAIGLPGKRNDPGCPCAWQERCRQSREDY